MLVGTVTDILSLLTILGQIIVVVLVFVLFSRGESAVFRMVRRHALAFGFVVALIATIGSLFYSEVAGYEPCVLCWYQRIMMYPLAFLFGIALLRKENCLAPYALALSIVGGLIAAYHYILQVVPKAPVPCSAIGYSATCTQQFVLQFGYITIPIMAFTAFAMIIVLMSFKLLNPKP